MVMGMLLFTIMTVFWRTRWLFLMFWRHSNARQDSKQGRLIDLIAVELDLHGTGSAGLGFQDAAHFPQRLRYGAGASLVLDALDLQMHVSELLADASAGRLSQLPDTRQWLKIRVVVDAQLC
ncbi:MAG: hypothetical protein DI597_21200 [Pseudoxanthomonas spadix]|nr:MAG: hypothetical protein DI597_21200 [Pseudoxanthomonas spadix]